ncbi:MAG TPA: PilC/PilY family type IV pilus protein [Nevskiaceae bacterium]
MLATRSVTPTARPRRLSTRLAAIAACAVIVFGAAHAAVLDENPIIDQTPLTSSKSVPPNMVLMLDDSGSMDSDYMPDAAYLAPYRSGIPTLGAAANDTDLSSPEVNGIFYNPDTSYIPPPKANGDLYENAGPASNPMSSVPNDPFNAKSGKGKSNVASIRGYSTFVVAEHDIGPMTWGCSKNGNDKPDHKPVESDTDSATCTGSRNGNYTPRIEATGPVCDRSVSNYPEASPTSSYATSYDPAHEWCTYRYDIAPYAATPSCGYAASYDQDRGLCVRDVQMRVFTYRTPNIARTRNGTNDRKTFARGDGNIPDYVNHYVGNDRTVTSDALQAPIPDPITLTAAQVCDKVLREAPDRDTNPDATCVSDLSTQQNVANWYSYYHTRMLLAKSGAMTALSQMPEEIRFGFGSINGGDTNDIPTPRFGYTMGSDGGENYVAKVQPFGDGSTGTQKQHFWTWLERLNATGQTPLREALNEVGKYYRDDDQPWQTSGTDTTQFACRQSYAILTTDGFWNGPDQQGVVAGNVDGSDGQTPDPIKGTNVTPYSYVAKPPFSDGTPTRDGTTGNPANYSGTLADVAMHYWKNDLRPDMPNEVPVGIEDPAFWQHMSLFTLGMGFQPTGIEGTADDGTSPPTVPQIFNWVNGGKPIDEFRWPQPSSNSINNIADLVHAAVNGHGGYFSAQDPTSFTAGIKGALARIEQRVGTGASLGANSYSLHRGSTTYQAVYSTGKWKGDLTAYAVNPDNGQIEGAPAWAAAASMPAWNKRTVWTYNPEHSSGTGFVQIDASNDDKLAATLAALSDDQRAALASSSTAADPAARATEAKDMVRYLLGDHGQETNAGSAGTYRSRDNALGDIVNSQPVYVGAPNASLFGGYEGAEYGGSGEPLEQPVAQTYRGFASAQKARSPTVWVTANDGMLHGFDATDGEEIFAYLPGAVITANIDGAKRTGIANLADPNYGGYNPHEYFNDGQITVADVYLPDDHPASPWRTVLVGTTGRGPARAIYAIDITEAKNIAPMWERSARVSQVGDASGSARKDIGQMVGAPVIARTSGGWKVFIGNGYNSANQTAALLEFDVRDGSLTSYATDDQPGNGLAPPVVWIDNPTDGRGTVAYAGDLLGRVWSFKLADPATQGNKLFTATDGTRPQPITAGMLAGQDPDSHAVWVFFGTGQYLADDDLKDTGLQTWYGLIVRSGSTVGSQHPVVPATRANLARRSITEEAAGDPRTDPPLPGARVVTTSGEGDAVTGGWYMDLKPPKGNAQGERMVVTNQFQSGLLLGTTRIPDHTDMCNPSGTGWVMAIKPFTGFNPSTVFFDLSGDEKFTDADKVAHGEDRRPAAGLSFNAVPNAPVFVGSRMLTTLDTAARSNINTAGPGTVGMVSWREFVTNN